MLPDDERQHAARADLARLLSACFYEPSVEFLEDNLFGQLATAAESADPALGVLAAELDAAFRAVPLQELLVDYTRLFLGPTHPLAPPYGSVWLDGGHPLMQESSMAVTALYDGAGFEIADDFRDLPDHVSVELEFLYALLFAEAQARRAADERAGEAARHARRQLIDAHLGAWVLPFSAAIEKGARSAFYPLLGRLTAAFVEREKGQAQHGG